MKQYRHRLLCIVFLAFLFVPLFGGRIKAGAETKKPIITVAKRIPGKVTLKWNKIENANCYFVYRSNQKKGSYKKLSTQKGCSFVDKNTREGKEYYYKVKAAVILYDKKGKFKSIAEKISAKQKVYATSKDARVVLLGECYAVGIENWARQFLGNNDYVFGKE